jgi:anaerobic selenocysteine-containing dehydrogenase
MGFDDACFEDSEDDMIRTLLDSPHEFVRGITLQEFDRKRFVRLHVSKDEPFLPFAEGGFGTPSGKCEFDVEKLAYEPPVESRLGDEALRARYPLELISPKTGDGMNSTFGHRDAVDDLQDVVALHARDAAARGIATGDRVRIFNDRGSIALRAEVNDSVPEGVVRTPGVRWAKRAPDGRNVNALTSDRLTDIGGGPVFYSCLVEVEKLPGKAVDLEGRAADAVVDHPDHPLVQPR